jgi:Coenzyme PQQ synthesis protein D (PqqD)
VVRHPSLSGVSELTIPRIAETDVVALATGVHRKGRRLIDGLTGQRYTLGGIALDIVVGLDGRHTLAEVTHRLAARYSVAVDSLLADIRVFLDELDANALIVVQRSWKARVVNWAALAGSVRPTKDPLSFIALDWMPSLRPTAKRHPARVLPLMAACLRAQGWLYVIILAVWLLVVLVLLHWETRPVASLGLGVAVAFIHPAWAIIVFYGLAVSHEAGHLCALRVLRIRLYYLVRRGWTVGVVHQDCDRLREGAVGLAGPIAASAVAAGASVVFLLSLPMLAPLGFTSVDAGLPIILAGLHILSLGPWSSDSRAVWPHAVTRLWLG